MPFVVHTLPDVQQSLDSLERVHTFRPGPAPRPVAGRAQLFAQVNGTGKLQLLVQMPSGTAIVVATEA